MYKVFCDDQLLYLPGDQELVIFNTKLELADNKSGSFEFDIPAVNPMHDKMKKLTSVIRVKKTGIVSSTDASSVWRRIFIIPRQWCVKGSLHIFWIQYRNRRHTTAILCVVS